MTEPENYHLEAKIQKEVYHLFPGTHTTVCLLILENGYSLVGESSPAPGKNFHPGKGRRVARSHAFSKIFALEGYAARSKLHQLTLEETEARRREIQSRANTWDEPGRRVP